MRCKLPVRNCRYEIAGTKLPAGSTNSDNTDFDNSADNHKRKYLPDDSWTLDCEETCIDDVGDVHMETYNTYNTKYKQTSFVCDPFTKVNHKSLVCILMEYESIYKITQMSMHWDRRLNRDGSCLSHGWYSLETYI